MKKSDRYIKIVKWSEQDGCYVGTCPSLMLGGVHGDNEIKVYGELCEVVEEWIKNGESYGEALPKPDAANKFSGKFVLRVGADLHHALFLEALRNNESLNSYCVRTLEENHASPPRRRTRRNDALAAKRQLSEMEFNKMNKALKNAEYIAMLNSSIEQAEHGNVVKYTKKQMRRMEEE